MGHNGIGYFCTFCVLALDMLSYNLVGTVTGADVLFINML